MAAGEVGDTGFGDGGVLFEHEADRLVVPFWDLEFGGELDGVDGVGMHDDVTSTGDVALLPGEAHQGAGLVEAVAQGVRIDLRTPDAGFVRSSKRVG